MGFCWFFTMFMAHTIFCFVAAVGVPSTSTQGVLVMITVFTWHEVTPGTSIGEARYSVYIRVLYSHMSFFTLTRREN